MRSLAAIEADTELTMSYIDTTQLTAIRQSELRSRYFFECTCSPCSASITNGIVEPTTDPTLHQIENSAMSLQAEADKLSPVEATTKLQRALEIFKNYPPYYQPYASIHHNAFLNAVVLRNWPLALHYALQAYFDIDPIHYRLNWHPVRVVREWVLLRLVVQIAALVQEGDESLKELARIDIDWRIVVEGLWREVSTGVLLSHGEDNALVEEVQLMGSGMGIGAGVFSEGDLANEWMKLRRIADRSGSCMLIAG